MSIKFTVVDAFTNIPFSGNPAGVVILPSNVQYDKQVLQGIAAELNLSQTAFIQTRVIVENKDEGGALSCPIKDEERLHGKGWSSFGLRWFTPTKEVRLCGHATLASSSILFSDESFVPASTHEIRFATLSGVLFAKRLVLNSASAQTHVKYELEFPAGEVAPASEPVARVVRDAVVKATSSDVVITYVGMVPPGPGPYEHFVLVDIDGAVPLEGMKVDTRMLATLAPDYVVVVLCQRPVHGSYDVGYRMFAPAAGINEDPVCGSATSFSVRYWAETTGKGSGEPMRLRAVSPRGGDVDLVWERSTSTAKIRGQARVASRGEIYL